MNSVEFYYSGHTGSVNSLAINSARNMCASGSGDGTIHVWPVETLQFLSRSESQLNSLKDDLNLKSATFCTEDMQSPVMTCDWLCGDESGGNSSKLLSLVAGYFNGMISVFDFNESEHANYSKFCIWNTKNQMPNRILKVFSPKSDSNTSADFFSLTTNSCCGWDIRMDDPAITIGNGEKSMQDAVLIEDNKLLVASEKSLKVFDFRYPANPITVKRLQKLPNK